MMSWEKDLKREWKYNKEGIKGGALVGVIVATYITATGINLNLLQEAKGFLFDRAVTLAPQQKETLILYSISILICTTIGYVLDKIIKPKV